MGIERSMDCSMDSSMSCPGVSQGIRRTLSIDYLFGGGVAISRASTIVCKTVHKIIAKQRKWLCL
jgi:hypothetical protein